MHNAPAVTCRLGRSLVELGALVAAALTGLLTIGAMVLNGDGFAQLAPPVSWVLLVLWLGLSSWALQRWWRTPCRLLAWDGQTWQLDGEDGQIWPVADVAGCLVLRWRSPARSLHLWATHGQCRTDWLPMRRAVYSCGPWQL